MALSALAHAAATMTLQSATIRCGSDHRLIGRWRRDVVELGRASWKMDAVHDARYPWSVPAMISASVGRRREHRVGLRNGF